MIASLADIDRPRLVATLFCVLSAAACSTPAPAPGPNFLEPMKRQEAFEPDAADRAAARLGEMVLLPDPDPQALDRALTQLRRAVPPELGDEAGDADALVPLGIYARNATLDDPIAYRKASKDLKRRKGVDDRLGKQLDEAVQDDALRLAGKRTLDDRMTLFARTFNAVSEPLGNSILSGAAIAPYAIASSVLNWSLQMLERDPLTVQGRQALAHHRTFLRRHPDAPEAEKARRRAGSAEQKLEKTHHRHLMRAGKAALDDSPFLAEELAERALHFEPDSKAALDLRNEARAQQAKLERQRAESLEFSSDPAAAELAPGELALIEALLDPEADLMEAALTLRDRQPDAPLTDEIDYILSIAQLEDDYESASWASLTEQSRRPGKMARHAGALLSNPSQNPYGAFIATKNRQRNRMVTFKILGNGSTGPRYKAIPPELSYLLQAPGMARSALTAPVRAVFGIFEPSPDFHRPTAVAAYRYLKRYPDGAYVPEVLGWLYDYEKGKKNWSAALRLADFRPGYALEERDELAEKAAEQYYQYAVKVPRRDRRGSALRGVVREYPDSEAGDMAGASVRNEFKNATAQRIRMTRAFLEENPWVVGSEGLGLIDDLHDGENDNGELHPEGITFLGGRAVEFAFMPESGKEDDTPLRVQREVSEERLARVISVLEETTHTNALLDPGEFITPDSQRDLYFERARLGLTDRPDLRPTAHSTYVYQGMRERYGIVRGRESILPFDLVFRGSFSDLSLGAFPRWREPKQTPDAFLYR